MSASTDLRDLLVAASAVTALVGQRVRFERAEQGDALPYVVLTLSDVERDIALDGSVGGAKSIFQIACWSNKRVQADAIASAVVAACLADQRVVTGPASEYVPELDVEGAIVTVDWWDD